MKNTIKKFLDEDHTELELPVLKLQDYIDILKSHGYEIGDTETNGFQVDFWIKFQKEDKQVTLAGSLFYGGYSISKTI